MIFVLDHPWALLALVLALPVAWLAWRSVQALSTVTVGVGLLLRLAVLALLVLAIARPSIGWGTDATSVIVVADGSASVPEARMAAASDGIREAAARRRPGDRIGAVGFAARADILGLPSGDPPGEVGARRSDSGASDIATALRTALALAPADTANRILLVSDGNSTAGDPLEVAALAEASGIPIDVVPIRYRHDREVEHVVRHQPVVQHDIGLGDTARSLQRQQFRVARARADNRDGRVRPRERGYRGQHRHGKLRRGR